MKILDAPEPRRNAVDIVIIHCYLERDCIPVKKRLPFKNNFYFSASAIDL